MALTKTPIELSSTPGIVDNSNATAITIDSSENVGIGTSSPSRQLTVQNSGNAIAAITSGTSSSSFLLMGDTDSDNIGMLKYNNADNSLGFYAGSNSSERMRIDSSGNLLVGTTSTDPAASSTETGVALKGGGFVSISRNDSAASVNINKIGSDGSLVDFRKDGDPVGSIGVVSGDNPYFTSASRGIRITGNNIRPCSTGGANLDNTISLGDTGQRFKDLYLSGTATIGTNGSEYANNYIRFKSGGAAFIDHLTVSQDINFRVSNASGLDKTPLTLKSDGVAYMPNGVYLGGTGAANKLDDYEEGTWQPIMAGDGASSGTQTYASSNTGRYTKVGDMVTCYFDFQVTALGTTTGAYATVTGFPFAISQSHIGGGHVNYHTSLSNTDGILVMYAAAGRAYLMEGAATYVARSDLTNNTRLMGQLTYYTTA